MSGAGPRLLTVGFLLFVFLIPVSQPISSAVLVVTVFVALLLEGRARLITTVMKRSWDALLYLFILVIGLWHSADKEGGIRVIETSLSLLAVPLVVHRQADFHRGEIRKVFLIFAAGLVTASAICLVNAGLKYNGKTEVFFFYQLTDVIGSHPTYLAYYLIAAITFGIYLLYERSHWPDLVVIATVVFLFGMLLLTGGVTAFVSIIYVFAFFLLRFILDWNSKEHRRAVLVVIVLAGGMFLFNELRNRDPSGFVMDDNWERIRLWEAALKASPLSIFGVGTGDYRHVLNTYYQSHGMTNFAASNFNAHNQFLETYLANGLAGLAVVLILLIRPIYLSVTRGNALGSLIFFPFLIYAMTEVFLGRYQGVVFFALMSQCFVAYHYSLRPALVLKQV